MPCLFIDIETVPIEIRNEEVKEYLMDKKISKEARSFNPLYSRIIVLGIKELNKPAEIYYDEKESELLNKFWTKVSSSPDTTIVTFNGYKFDIPFILIRSTIHSVSQPLNINTNRWSMEKSNHFDMMMFFSHYETFLNPSLEILAKILKVDTTNIEEVSAKGSDIERLYEEGNIELIKKKCQRDIEILEKVFKKAHSIP